MAEPRDLIFVVDDDPCTCLAIEGLLRCAGLAFRSFGSSRDFLDYLPRDASACVVLIVGLPGNDGLELQCELTARAVPLPIVFISRRGDIPTSVKAIKATAVGLVAKPFHVQDLLSAVREALEDARRARDACAAGADLRARRDSLTPRQCQVLDLVAEGLLNKQIGYKLGISEITVKIHRRLAMKKMGASSVPDLVRMADRMGPLRVLP